MDNIKNLPAMEIIALYLAKAGLSQEEINVLLARFLEEEKIVESK